MLVFYKGSEIVAAYENESLPSTLHPECDSAIVPASSITFHNPGTPVFTTDVPDRTIRTVTVTLGGKPMPVIWADRAALIAEYLYAVNQHEAHFTVTLSDGSVVDNVSKSEAKSAIDDLGLARPRP